MNDIASFPLNLPKVPLVVWRTSVGVANIAAGRHAVGQSIRAGGGIIGAHGRQMQEREAEEKHDGDSTGHER